MQKKWFRIFTILGIIILLGNVAATIWGGNTSPSKTDWLTFISGWIGGISTLIIGIIAYSQNKNYTLISTKTEINNNIKNERKEVLEICNQLTQYSKYVNFISFKFDDINKQKSELSYKFHLDELREFIMINTTRFQLFDYIPINMESIVGKLLQKQMETYEEYVKLLDCNNNDNLSVLIDVINNKTLSWINSVVEIRNNIIKELDDLSITLFTLNSVEKVNKFLNNLKEKTYVARTNSNSLIDKMIQERKYKKENTNE